MEKALLRSILEGQANGTHLVVNAAAASTWPEIRFSSFGCVPKPGVDPNEEVRVIHDLSYPHGDSTNDYSDQDTLPALSYTSVDAIAKRILELRSRFPGVAIYMMKGDVKSTFRLIPVNENISSMFASKVSEYDLAIVDLALPFGWTGSPAHYGAFGGAVSFMVWCESPATMDRKSNDMDTFFCYDWVDDHVLIEPASADRLVACECTLRLPMMAVLGPRSINEKKFIKWDTTLVALGLEWDKCAATVSMPEAKIEKALERIRDLRRQTSTTRSTLEKLLGSLRHICLYDRSAKPFFQRLLILWRKAPRYGTIQLSRDARLDLDWFEAIVMPAFGLLASKPESVGA